MPIEKNAYLGVPCDKIDGDYTPSLTATMLFHSDKEKRQNYLQLYAVEHFADVIKTATNAIECLQQQKAAMGTRGPHREPPILKPQDSPLLSINQLFKQPELLALLDNVPKAFSEKMFNTAIGDGILSGLCLMYYCALDTMKLVRNEKTGSVILPSKNIIKYIAIQHNLGRERKLGCPTDRNSEFYYPQIGQTPLKNWDNSSKVAHLWAAWLSSRKSTDIPHINNMWDGVNRENFIAQALAYQKFIERFFNGTTVAQSHRKKVAPLLLCYRSTDEQETTDISLIEEVVRHHSLHYKRNKEYLR